MVMSTPNTFGLYKIFFDKAEKYIRDKYRNYAAKNNNAGEKAITRFLGQLASEIIGQTGLYKKTPRPTASEKGENIATPHKICEDTYRQNLKIGSGGIFYGLFLIMGFSKNLSRSKPALIWLT
jgi:hypothetical protein